MNTMKNILEENIAQMGLVETISAPYIALVLGTAFLCGMILYIIYKFFYRGAVYSENYGLLIVMSTMTVAFIIMTISSNIVLSLGMVGALSIVRFRAAVKDPLDVGFLFLAIAAGLTAGAGLFVLAIIGTAVISIVFMLLFFLGKSTMSYLLVVRCNASAEEEVADVMSTLKSKLKSKSANGVSTELTYTIRLGKDDIVAELLEIEGVENALLVSYTGDAQY